MEVIPGPSRCGRTSPDPPPSLVPPPPTTRERKPARYVLFGLRKQNPLGTGFRDWESDWSIVGCRGGCALIWYKYREGQNVI